MSVDFDFPIAGVGFTAAISKKILSEPLRAKTRRAAGHYNALLVPQAAIDGCFAVRFVTLGVDRTNAAAFEAWKPELNVT